MQPTVVELALGARQCIAVVGGPDDNSTVHQVVTFKLREDLADAQIHRPDVVVMTGNVGAYRR